MTLSEIERYERGDVAVHQWGALLTADGSWADWRRVYDLLAGTPANLRTRRSIADAMRRVHRDRGP